MSNLPELMLRRERRTFAAWDEFVSAELVAKSDAAVRELIDRLIALGDAPICEQVRSEIDHCIRRFNALDREWTHHWICTIEREDICEALWKLISLCGCKVTEEWFSERNW